MQVKDDNQWYLIATFRDRICGVVARGHDPAHQEPHRQLKNFMPNYFANSFATDVRQCIDTKREARRATPAVHRGQKRWGIATPVVSASGNVHAVVLWVGTTPEPTEKCPFVVGAWEWELLTHRISIFGPGVPEMYGHPEWVVGHRYPMSELTGLISAMAQMPEAERVLDRAVDGERSLFGFAADHPGRAGNTAEMRSAMEIVRGDDGVNRWLGFSWEVTDYVPLPQRSLETEALIDLAQDSPGWKMLMLRKPIELVKPIGERLEVHVDNFSKRVVVHSDYRSVPRQIEAKLDEGTAEGVVKLLGVDDKWETYRVRASLSLQNWAFVRMLRLPDDITDTDELS